MQRLRQAQPNQGEALARTAASASCCICLAVLGPSQAIASVLSWLLALAASAWLVVATQSEQPFSSPGSVGWREAMTLMLASCCIWVSPLAWF
jgi:Tfp pilus assembly protein PilN